MGYGDGYQQGATGAGRFGCSVIQVEEPTIHFIACYHPEATDTLNFLTEALNHELDGLDAAEVWIHTCWGNPMIHALFDQTSYASALEIYLDRISCDVLTLEMKDRVFAEIEFLGAWKGKTRKKFAIGVVSHRTLNAETPVDVAQDIRKALKYVDVEVSSSRRIVALVGEALIDLLHFTKALQPHRAPTLFAASTACLKPTYLAQILAD